MLDLQRADLSRRDMLSGAALASLATAVTVGGSTSAGAQAGSATEQARNFPPPTTISEAAQAYLRKGNAQPAPPPVPSPGDAAGWQAIIAQGNKSLPIDLILKMPGIDIETRRIGNAACYVATPQGISAADRRKAHLSIHGGGWILFGGKAAMALGKITAMQFGGVTFAVDYRMPPGSPFPAGLDDCFDVYRAMLKDYGAKNILVSGTSAGGNLAAALIHRIKDAGLDRPCALVLDTPVTDLTNAGDTWQVLRGLDPVLRDPDGVGSTALYLNGRDPRHPYLSPLFGELASFPPTHLISGTRDRLLSDTVRMHAALRAAGVEADLFVGEGMPHGGFGKLTPEDAAVLKDTRRWLSTRWPVGG